MNNKKKFSKKYRQGVFLLGDKKIEYFVMPQSENEELTDFIYRMINSESDKYVLGVSDKVPFLLRPLLCLWGMC